MNISLLCRDDICFNIPFNDFSNMEDFFLKNMIIDLNQNIEDQNQININEDYEVVKSIVDSMRLNTLIFSEKTNLRYMKALGEKWCVPFWLINMIDEELQESKIFNLIKFIKIFYGDTLRCKICHCGFKINENKYNSCKTHFNNGPMKNSNNYACCNKEEPCLVGYHVPDINSGVSTPLIQIINNIKDLI